MITHKRPPKFHGQRDNLVDLFPGTFSRPRRDCPTGWKVGLHHPGDLTSIAEDPHFDTRRANIIVYPDPRRLRTDLAEQLALDLLEVDSVAGVRVELCCFIDGEI